MGVFLFFIRECEKDDDVDAKYEKFVKALAGVNWIQKHPVIQFSNQILRGNENALREVLFLKKKPTTFFLLFDDPPSSSYILTLTPLFLLNLSDVAKLYNVKLNSLFKLSALKLLKKLRRQRHILHKKWFKDTD